MFGQGKSWKTSGTLLGCSENTFQLLLKKIDLKSNMFENETGVLKQS